MLIVGGGAALTAIAAWLVWLAVRPRRASWRAQAHAQRVAAYEDTRPHQARTAHLAPGE